MALKVVMLFLNISDFSPRPLIAYFILKNGLSSLREDLASRHMDLAFPLKVFLHESCLYKLLFTSEEVFLYLCSSIFYDLSKKQIKLNQSDLLLARRHIHFKQYLILMHTYIFMYNYVSVFSSALLTVLRL